MGYCSANDHDAWLKAIHTDQLTWTHVSDLKFWDNDVAKLYSVRAVPQNFLLDPAYLSDIRRQSVHENVS